MDLAEFIPRWTESSASERANKDAFLLELCDVLGVPRPDPTTGDSAADRYVFERDAVLVAEGQKRSVGKIDLYKDGCFLLEANFYVGTVLAHPKSWLVVGTFWPRRGRSGNPTGRTGDLFA